MKQAIEFFPEEFRSVNINNKFITDKYLISNYGNIYSNHSNRFLKQQVDIDGYYKISLNFNEDRYFLSISRLVLMTFKPILLPELFQANHRNGDKSENGVWNLEWLTQAENIRHAYITGLTNQIGENHHATKLTNDQVHYICKCLEDGKTYEEICVLFRIPEYDFRKFKDIIHSIVKKESWIHISKNYNISYKRQYNMIYGEEMVHIICKCLEDGKTYEEICDIINIHDDKIKQFMYNIVSKSVFKDISNQYKIIIPESEKDPIFTEEQIHYICNMLKNDIKSPEILKNMGIDLYSFDNKKRHCIINCISNIKRKKSFKQISDQYF